MPFRHAVVVKDPTDLVNHLHSQMGLDIHETILKVGIDGGRGSLKVFNENSGIYSGCVELSSTLHLMFP